jgi:hypothetical protein
MTTIVIAGEGKANQGVFVINAALIPLQQSFLLLVSDQAEFGVGTVTLSAPPTIPGTGAVSSPFSLFGLKNNLLANLLGKMASKLLNLPVLSLILIKEEEIKVEIIMKTAVEAVKNAIDQVLKKPEFRNIGKNPNDRPNSNE